MPNKIVRMGWLERYSSHKHKWRPCYCRMKECGTLYWFNNTTSAEKGFVEIQDTWKQVTVGLHTQQMVDRPIVPPNNSTNNLIAILDLGNVRVVFWFLCKTADEVKLWESAFQCCSLPVFNTTPPRQSAVSSHMGQQTQQRQPVGTRPVRRQVTDGVVYSQRAKDNHEELQPRRNTVHDIPSADTHQDEIVKLVTPLESRLMQMQVNAPPSYVEVLDEGSTSGCIAPREDYQDVSPSDAAQEYCYVSIIPTEATYCNTEDDDAYLIPTPSIEATPLPTNVLHTDQSDRTSAINLQDYSSESLYTTISENIERLLPLGSGPSENTGTRLGLISNDKFLFTYNATKAVGKKRLRVPKWFDSSTSYCVCKDNFVVVGNANRQTGCYVRWINITNTEMTDLPNLPYSIAGAGVACVSAYIYVFGGTRFCQGQWIKSNAVYCYKRDSGAAQWSKLDCMPCAVSCPIVTVVGANIFVLGGNDASRSPTSSAQIFNTTRLSWTTMQPLPQACTTRDGGATSYKGRLIVLTKSMLIELEADTTWSVRERYHHAVDNVNPVVLNNHVFACVKNSAGYRVMELQGGIHRWTRKDIDISNCFNQCYVFTFNG